jgi:serine/threonine protein kinase
MDPDVSSILATGAVFAEDFEVQRLVANEAHGAVYAVVQRSTGRPRTLRVLTATGDDAAGLRQRFARDAMLAARVESDHVARVLASGVDRVTGHPWICSELLTGDDLDGVVRVRGALPVAEVAEVCRQVCHALAAAHRVGVVHGGLSPAKVRLTESRTVGLPFVAKVTDFGVDRLLHTTLGDADTVKDLASPQWMAPEQTDPGAALTPATDVFALGLLTFWLLTGHTYWRASPKGAHGAAALRELLSPTRVAASARAAELGVSTRVPVGFDAWLARCLVIDPTQRFADGAAAGDALLPLLRPGVAAVPKTAALTAVPLAPGVTSIARTEALPAVSRMSSGTEALPRAVIEQAIAPPSSSPRVLGAAPPPNAPPAMRAPARSPRRWPWVLLGVGLIAGGAELALTLSHRTDPAAPAVTGMDAGVGAHPGGGAAGRRDAGAAARVEPPGRRRGAARARRSSVARRGRRRGVALVLRRAHGVGPRGADAARRGHPSAAP